MITSKSEVRLRLVSAYTSVSRHMDLQCIYIKLKFVRPCLGYFGSPGTDWT